MIFILDKVFHPCYRPPFMGKVVEQNPFTETDRLSLPSHLLAVLDHTRGLIRKHVPAGVLASLCENRLDALTDDIQKLGHAPCIDVPWSLCHGLCGDDNKSRVAGSLAALIYLGCDLLDDFHDQELSSKQQESSQAFASLAGSLLLSSLPTLTVSEFFDSDDQKSFIACRIIAESLQKMAQGQAQDIQSRFDPGLSVEEVEAMAVAKSGEEMALFCYLSALLAGAHEQVRQGCARFGRDLATALQIISDLTDIFEKPKSNDLQQGTLTMPLVLHCLRLAKGEKEFFCKLWRTSAQDPQARQILQNTLRESGAVAHSALMIETYCDRARATLKSLPLHQKSKNNLEDLVEEISRYALFHLQSFLKGTSPLKIPVALMGM